MNGTIKNVNQDKGYAFIKGEDGKEYFMHRSALKSGNFRDLEKGALVTFEDSEGLKGLRAEDVFLA
jgi:cold shock protein